MIAASIRYGSRAGSAGRFAAAVLLLLCLSAGDGRAQAVTSDHVYQSVRDAQAEVLLLLNANFSPTDLPKVELLKGRQPRHVVQEVYRLLRRMTLLRQINGLRTPPLIPLPVREMTPLDVMARMDRLLSEIRGLREPFAIELDPKPAEVPEGKTSSDVLVELRILGVLIQRLDLPTVVQNDVFRIALAIKADAEQIRVTLGAPEPRATPADQRGMKSRHVYVRSLHLLNKLKRIVEEGKDLAIPGGVVPPPPKTGRIRPADLLDTMLVIQADLSSLKAVVGATRPAPEFPPQVGKTPNDVYRLVEEVMALLDAIAEVS